MMIKPLSIAAAAGLLIATTALGHAQSSGQRMPDSTPGQKMQDRGSVSGQPGGAEAVEADQRDPRPLGRPERRVELDDPGRGGDHDVHPAPVGPLPNLHVVPPEHWTGADLAA